MSTVQDKHPVSRRPSVEALGSVEIFQVLVICPYYEWVFRPLLPVTPLQRHLHRQKFPVTHVVIPFHGVEKMGEESGRMQLLVLG